MTDLTVYVILGLVIPGLLVIGIALRDLIIRYYDEYRHHHHHRHHHGSHHPA